MTLLINSADLARLTHVPLSCSVEEASNIVIFFLQITITDNAYYFSMAANSCLHWSIITAQMTKFKF